MLRGQRVLLLLRRQSCLNGYCGARENVMRFERVSVRAQRRNEHVRRAHDHRPLPQLLRQRAHELHPLPRVRVGIGAQIRLAVDGAKPGAIRVKIHAHGPHASADQVAYQVQAGLKDARNYYRRPIRTCPLDARRSAQSLPHGVLSHWPPSWHQIIQEFHFGTWLKNSIHAAAFLRPSVVDSYPRRGVLVSESRSLSLPQGSESG